MQNLVGLFLDCFIFAAKTKKNFQKGEQPTVAEMHESIEEIFDAIEQRNTFADQVETKDHLYSDEIYNNAKFAVVAYIDEMLFSSSWNSANDWMKSSLQKTMFNTVCAGQEFFDRLRVIDGLGTREERDLAELFNYCIALGFQGVYYEDKDKLQSIMRNLYTKIIKHDESYAMYRQDLPLAEDIEVSSIFNLSGKSILGICVGVVVVASVGITFMLAIELSVALEFFANLY